jgi:hypothetical protein
MDAMVKLDALNRTLVEHLRVCAGRLRVSVTAGSERTIAFSCADCGERFSETFTHDDAMTLRAASLRDS